MALLISINFFSFFKGSGKFLDGRRRCQGLSAFMGHLWGPPQGPEVRLRPVGRHPDVLRHREGRLVGELQGDVVPSGIYGVKLKHRMKYVNQRSKQHKHFLTFEF